MMWKNSTNVYIPPLDWWTVERNKPRDTATGKTENAAAGYALTEGDGRNIGYSAEDSESSSEESPTDSKQENDYFAPDPYQEAEDQPETEWFTLRGGRGV